MTAPLDALTARENGFGEDGGYAKKWVRVQLGPVPLAFPNSPGRVRAVRYHDLHHVLTGYQTDVVGEAEIGAWEVASGCAGFWAAWLLNLQAMALGLLAGAPGRLWRAFLRGRRTRNLYRMAFDEALLETRVGALRSRLGLDVVGTTPGAARARERAAFAGWLALAVAVGAATLALLAAPLVLLVRWLA